MMRRKADVCIGHRAAQEIDRLFMARIEFSHVSQMLRSAGLVPGMEFRMRSGEAPGAAILRKLYDLGADIVYIIGETREHGGTAGRTNAAPYASDKELRRQAASRATAEIKRLADAAGVTPSRFARERMGMPTSSYSQLSHGVNAVGAHMLQRLHAAGADIVYVVTGAEAVRK